MVLAQGKRVVALAGGVGGAKLADGLAQVLPPEQLTIVGNVADDFELYGLHISPDLDTLMYTLAGVANSATGWGVADETWGALDMLARYGEEPWFRLGDRDLATHLLRTHALRRGETLTDVTRRLSSALGVKPALLPATDDPLMTLLDTAQDGTLEFQDYFVRRRWQPVVTRVWLRGVEQARPTESVLAALQAADLIVFCPSNPVLSLEPILALPGLRETIRARRGRCVAVSPFVGGAAVKGPAAKLMAELGLDISPRGLADFYGGLLDGLIVDVSDRALAAKTRVDALVTPTLMQTREDRRRLAEVVLEWVGL